ncbi:hypothetical protein, conserved [Babesia ovata]|uniref:Uncharacterized protein n=1 Tax=Babesia ovata TaxID=189622 RepID=A0A2H6KCQ2_9APIC|nr:uncharacterized protein BOVATA_022580 [Babesia ovata]GBE60765.1 hypothetical protein, conserved [Babesia ovata]
MMQRRYLGQAPSGRQLNSIEASWTEAKKLFYKPALGYTEFAKRVEALRMLAFWALVTGLTLDIALNPPKSQYWAKWNLIKMPSRIMEKFGGQAKPVTPPEPAKLGADLLTDASREYHRICNL